MKKIFQKSGIVFMLIGLVLFNTLPQILSAFLMYTKNNFLTKGNIFTISIFSNILTYVLLTIGISKYLESSNKFKDLIKGLPILIGYLLIMLIDNIFVMHGLDNTLIISIIHLLLNGLILSISILLSIFNITKKRFKINFFNIIKVILTAILIYCIPELLCGLLGTKFNGNPFTISLLNGLIYGLLMWLFLVLSIYIVNKTLTIDIKNSINDYIMGATALIIFITVIVINSNNNISNVKNINNIISYSLASGDYAFDEMEVLTAKAFYNSAEEYKCAYQFATDSSFDTKDCSGELLELFKTLNSENPINVLKRKVNNGSANMYDIEALMKLMKDSNDKDIKKVTKYLISNMNFTRTTILPFDLTDNDKNKLKEDLSKYDKHITVRKYIDIYVEWLNQGKMNSNVINTANKIAKDNPDEIALQAAAIKFYLDSSINVNGDSTVVDNFINLTKDEILKKNEEEIINYKTYVALAYQACNANAKVISFLEEFEKDKISPYLGSLLLVSYKKNGEYEKAENIALEVLEKDEYNVEALAFLSIYKLQSDLNSSIDYATKLAYVIETKKENYLGADISLGLYRVYLKGYYESPDSRFCPYHNFYNDMNDEQKQKITNNEILNAYLIGQGLSAENLDTLNKVISKYDYISYLYYYRAVYEINNKQGEKAVEDLEKAISLGNKNPFFYSELGFAYELVGDLKKSLAAFELADSTIDELGLGSTTYNYNNIHNYFSVYINNAKHAMYESEGEH